jgi:hypothetical protein
VPRVEEAQPERAPSLDRDRHEGSRLDRARSERDRRPRGEPRDEHVVGMGDDVPTFILKSFAERRAG